MYSVGEVPIVFALLMCQASYPCLWLLHPGPLATNFIPSSCSRNSATLCDGCIIFLWSEKCLFSLSFIAFLKHLESCIVHVHVLRDLGY